MTRLRLAGWGYLAAFSVHTFDHLRRGSDSVTEALYVAGNLSSFVSVAAIVLVLTRHRLSALVAVAVGFPQAAAFTAAHLLPTWSELSDSFVSGDASWFSWAAAVAEIGGALLLGLAGLRELRTQRSMLAGPAEVRPA